MLSIEADRVVVDTTQQSLWFDPQGIHLERAQGEPEDLMPWGEVSDLRLIGPASTRFSWSILQGLLEVLAPVSLRSRNVRLEVETARHGWSFLEFEAGQSAPYAPPILDALEALVDFLSGEGKTRLLGDAPFMLRALSVAEGSHSWFTPLTHHRVRRGLRALG
jgi:hypothetical protein